MTLFISLLVGMLTFNVLNIIEQIILGDRGRDNQISNYYKYIKGNTIAKKKRKIQFIKLSSYEKITPKISILYAIPVCICIFIITYLVFKSVGLAFFICLLGLAYPKTMINRRIKKKRDTLNSQLIDALSSIVSSLKAGLSINSAIIKCADDLEKLYSFTKDKPMLDEFKKIKSDLDMGLSVDEALKNFMERLNMEDVDDFVNSVIIVRQKGGNLIDVMESVSKIISDKIQIRREIDILTTSKKFEAKIMTMIPIFIIIILSTFSRSYMEPLYESLIGNILIVIGFSLLVLNYFIANKIVDIDI